MKLSQWAKKRGIHYNTAYAWFKTGRISNARQLETGTILVEEDEDRPLKEYMAEVISLLKEINEKLK